MSDIAAGTRKKVIQFPLDHSQARDELNLCEFPLAVLSNRVPHDSLELSFTDRVWDKAKDDFVERSLQISAPPNYGLPTAKDEEVLLALIHLTDQVNRFESPTVHFTRYELIKLLGWNEGGKSYQRVRDSLARWKSVTLDYRNAWRDHKNQSWVSEIFSIIDNVTIYDIDDAKRKRTADDQLNLPLSTFTWNRVFFDSMQAKYFKRLDFGFYQRLKTPTAKRVFRFLDKRFGSGRDRWEFDLHEFAFEHIGLSRKYDTGKLKEKLAPAFSELESEGYLDAMEHGERYIKRGKQWRVVFVRAKPATNQPKLSPLAAELHRRGVSPQVASELVKTNGKDLIEKQISYFDWIIEHDSARLKNPAGFLPESIRKNFQPPAGYRTPEALAQAARSQAALKAENAKRLDQENEYRRQQQLQRDHIALVRSQLTEEELKHLQEKAIAEADDVDRQVLNTPNLRDIHLELLVDKLLNRMQPDQTRRIPNSP